MGNKTHKEKRDESIRKILDAALEVFAEVGYAGARMDAIAEKAGVNKAMIYYHIGDKKTLHTRVLHHAFGDTTLGIVGKIRVVQSPQEKFRIYLRDILSLVEKNPFIPHIMMWEFASGRSNLPELAVQDMAGLLKILSGILQEGIRNDEFTSVNPLPPHLTAIGAMVIYRAIEPLISKYLPKHMPADQNLINSDFRSEIENLILKGVEKKGV